SFALSHSPELPEALSALAAHHRRKHAAAEADGQAAEAALHRQQLAFYDRGEHRAWLSGEGALTLQTYPPGALVTLHRLSLVDRQLKAGPGKDFGQTPLSARLLPMGRYLLRLEHPEREPVTYPVIITRQRHWDGVPPGGQEPVPVILPPAGSLGEGDVYVPAGWALLGGDARLVSPRRWEWVEGFVIRRCPVTNREYLAFLDALVEAGREEEALRWVPRARAGRTGEQGAMVYGRRPDGTFELVPDADGDLWLPDWPVVLVRGDAGKAYADWLRAQTGVPWQLPQESWWEKAARGVDGRLYPWGDHRDASFANVRDRNPDRPLPEAVGSSAADQSPYGIFDTAGNVREWCADRFQTPGNQQTVRGGCFFFWSDPLYARVGLDPQVAGDTIGFRLAARPSWLSPLE
ncbi:MAG: sulfatase activating formylglycine-generating enzyme, partial [Myxococcota bacterium]